MNEYGIHFITKKITKQNPWILLNMNNFQYYHAMVLWKLLSGRKVFLYFACVWKIYTQNYAELAVKTIKQLLIFCTIYLCKKTFFSIVHKATSIKIETDLYIHVSNTEQDFWNLFAKKHYPYHNIFLFNFSINKASFSQHTIYCNEKSDLVLTKI